MIEPKQQSVSIDTVGIWTFQRLCDDDLPLLHRWMNEPGVVRFWEGDDVSWPGIVTTYGSPEARESLSTEYPNFEYDAQEADFDWEHVEGYIALIDGEPTGWIQCYAVEDYDDEDEVKAWLELSFDPTGAGIDYLVADPTTRGKGLGSSMIRHFIDEVVFGLHPNWTQVGASPVRENTASCGALAKAGLQLLGSFDDPEFGPCDLYAQRR